MNIYHLYSASNPSKKYMVKFVNEKSGKINTIQFGASGMSDFTLNKDEKRKNSYILRHMNDKINDPNYAGFWSLNLLWNQLTLEKSIKDTEKRYLITIINNI